MELRQKCIWVIGASSGIGRELALQLAAKGNYVIASGRNERSLDLLTAVSPGRIKPFVFDVTSDKAGLAKAKSNLNDATDYLDAVLYCAGTCEYEDNLSFEPEMYERVFDVNFLGAVRSLNLAMPLLKNSKTKPLIALVGSLSSVVGFPRAEAYGASKAAIEYLARALKADSANLPLDVRLIRPGFVETPMTKQNDFPMPWIIGAEEAARVIVKGLEKKKFLIDFPHKLSFLLYFFRFVPALWFRLVAPKVTKHHKKSWV